MKKCLYIVVLALAVSAALSLTSCDSGDTEPGIVSISVGRAVTVAGGGTDWHFDPNDPTKTVDISAWTHEVWLYNSSGQQKGHYDDQTTINGTMTFTVSPTGSYEFYVEASDPADGLSAVGFLTKNITSGDNGKIGIAMRLPFEFDGGVTINQQGAYGSPITANFTRDTRDGRQYTPLEAAYEWTNADTNTVISGETGASITPSTPGRYTVEVSARGYMNETGGPFTFWGVPIAGDFDVGGGGLNQVAGSVTAVTITAKSGKTQGTVNNIRYNNSNTLPTTAGEYTVTFDVLTDNITNLWTAATGLNAGTLKITAPNRTPVLEDYIIRNLTQKTQGNGYLVQLVSVTPKEGKSTGTVVVSYKDPADSYTWNTGLPTDITIAQTIPVRFTVAAATGWNAVTVPIDAGVLTLIDPSDVIEVNSEAQWNSTYLTSTMTAGADQDHCNVYLIEVTAPFNVTNGFSGNMFSGAGNTNITINGNNHAITLTGTGSLFWLSNDSTTVTMNNLTLIGNGSNTLPLVNLLDGTLTMNGGAIKSNVYTGGGGGVQIGSGGYNSKFIMNSGEISGNTAGWGGGVMVSGGNHIFTMNGGEIKNNTANDALNFGGGGVSVSGTFIMEGGTISGNTSYSNGGGVSVQNDATFHIVSGTIYGTDYTANTSLQNKLQASSSGDGAALYVGASGDASYGDGQGGPWSDLVLSTTYIDTTITVVNGNRTQ